jgi:tRNA threonylcarbamoyladenosine biosynthesis protein TsaB
MSLILSIDTATDNASVSISKEGAIIAEVSNTAQKDHGGYLQPAIKSMLITSGISIDQIDAIAISAGPGSYTGLRVGMSSAKGLCYALNKPLIALGTLEILAYAAIMETDTGNLNSNRIFCPMIDARRMEVFTALYNSTLQTVLEPRTLVLNEESFANSLLKSQVLFFGNGAQKWKRICNHKNAFFFSILNNTLAMNRLAYKKFNQNDFSDLAYSEPLYLKEFFQGFTSN